MAEAAKLPTADTKPHAGSLNTDDLELFGEMVAEQILEIRKVDTDDLERFGEMVAEQLLEIRKSIPAAPSAPDAPMAPVVNVTTPAPQVTFQASESPAPVVNVETAAPVINVAASPPIINVAPGPAPNVNLGFDADAIAQPLVGMSANVKDNGTALIAVLQAMLGVMKLQLEATMEQTRTNEAVAAALTAPRELTTDANGKPTGVVIRAAIN